jgi:hypothetical protein
MCDYCCDCCLNSGPGDMAAHMAADLAPPTTATMDRSQPLLPENAGQPTGLVPSEANDTAPTTCSKCKDCVGTLACGSAGAYLCCIGLKFAGVVKAPWILALK